MPKEKHADITIKYVGRWPGLQEVLAMSTSLDSGWVFQLL